MTYLIFVLIPDVFSSVWENGMAKCCSRQSASLISLLALSLYVHSNLDLNGLIFYKRNYEKILMILRIYHVESIKPPMKEILHLW